MKAIVLVDEHWGIGNDGDQIIYIPGDLKYFRKTTMGHPVILGRKTLATFPGGRPLKGRRNMILSRSPGFAPEGAEVFQNLPALLEAAPEDAFVLGGASVYAALLDRCGTAYVTRIEASFPGPDCFFPNLDRLGAWRLLRAEAVLSEGELAYQFLEYGNDAPLARDGG